MDHQHSSEKHHVQAKWDLNTTPLRLSAQRQSYYFSYDHEEFWDTKTVGCSSEEYNNVLHIEQENQQIKASQKKQSETSSFYLDTKLDNSKNYILTLQLDRPESSNIFFGILSGNEKRSVVLGDGNMIHYEDRFGGKTSQIVKGQVHSGQTEVKEKLLQLRVNINKRHWEVSTPDYSSISQLDQEIKINPNEQYYFSFALSNYSSIIIQDIREVSEFTNHHEQEQTN